MKKQRKEAQSVGENDTIILSDALCTFPFGSRLGQTENVQNSPSGKVLKTQKNPAEIERFQPDLVGV